MTPTLLKQSLDYETGNRLETHVSSWIIEQAENYQDAEGVLRDLFHGGCESGYVTHLIYTDDCHAFVHEYFAEIEMILETLAEDYGAATLGDILLKDRSFHWDRLAWLAFEETARQVALRSNIIL